MTSRDAAPEQQPRPPDLSLWQRGISAGIASFISSLTLNPLDVVKTRMQASAAHRIANAGASSAAHPGLYALHINKNSAIFTSNKPLLRTPPLKNTLPQYRSVVDGLIRIARQEGLLSLWRGTDAAILMTVPLVAIYLPLYDSLMANLTPLGAAAPLVAGATSRGLAGFVTAPLELARTRLQMGLQHSRGGGNSTNSGILSQLTSRPGASRWCQITSMWRGFGSSLAKDVPFAALYWTLLEPLREALMTDQSRAAIWQLNKGIPPPPPPPPRAATSIPPTSLEILLVNIGAAGVAASLAASITTPFDVVKTKQQTAKNKPGGIMHCLTKVYSTGGVKALFTGVGPRTARTAGGYAVVTSLFEVLKEWARHTS